ncbi:hypothetical protein Syun_010505 [Stephania yunnanensis]|uniref:Transglycosylase SLT domain-containing protein n=1 Tax=Stephania yunnanensis TaxID=152371 RepID=A0AAP0KGK5_9MAGN
MAVSFKYWDECLDPQDLEALWGDPEVSKEWIDAGEDRSQKVHLSRDPDGQTYLTQTEMKAVAAIIVRRHFISQIDPDIICAIAELESDRQLLATRYNKKIKDYTIGIMQLLPQTAEWLFREMGYRAYDIIGNPDMLYRPFTSVYFGAAYLNWLSSYEGIERMEEFVVRAYRHGTKKATHKSTLKCWQLYLSVKQSLPSRRLTLENHNSMPEFSPVPPVSLNTGDTWVRWDSRTSAGDMEEMWKHPAVLKEWTRSGERRGRVRFSHDAEKRPYLSRTELMAVAEIVVSRHFSGGGIKPTVLCALAEVTSMRFINGVGLHTGLMGIEYHKALWLYKELGYRDYRVESVESLTNPFVSLYFAAAYLVWLSQYEGRERTPQFVIQAYLGGPDNVSLQETGPLWRKFEDALSHYEDTNKEQGNCSIL